MGLGLYLGAQLSEAWSPEQTLERIADWTRKTLPEVTLRLGNDTGYLTVLLYLHPAAEDVEIMLDQPGHLLVSAKTNTVGPGYHAYLVSLLDSFAQELSLKWEPCSDEDETEYGDETDYFLSRDFEALQKAMLAWIRATSYSLADHEEGNFDVMMGFDHHFDYPAFARTPMGPRSKEWFEAVQQDPAQGKDIFAWWEKDKDSSYYLGLALVLMWNEVRWRLPDTEQEEELHNRVLDALEAAFRLDPSRHYPWTEWAELIELAGRSGTVEEWVHKQAQAAPSETPLGYRRKAMQVRLAGGWSIRLPGRFSEEWEEDGTFCAWDEHRTLWFTALESADDIAPENLEKAVGRSLAKHDMHFERKEGKLLSRAVLGWVQTDEESYWMLDSDSMVGSARAICTICYDDENDREWVLSTWQSLQHASANE